MSILALLQNMWLKNPESFCRSMERYIGDPDLQAKMRACMIKYALFAGCLTGRRLRQAFGPDLCDEIVWEEASPVVADNPRDYHPPDGVHIKAILLRYEPDIVLTFTRRGEKEIRAYCEMQDPLLRFFSGPHPAARGPDVMQQLYDLNHRLLAILHPEEMV